MPCLCQRCGATCDPWRMERAEIRVGRVTGWRVHLCPACTQIVERAVLDALQAPHSATGEEPSA